MFKNWGSDPKCNTHLPWELHKNVEETECIIKSWIESYKEDKFRWIIELKKENIAIGGIDVVRINKQAEICEVGYCIGSNFWNKGYTTEALNKVLDYLFNECDFILIEAAHHESNIASGKVMEKCGMIKECSLRKRAYNRETNSVEALIFHSITKEEFNKERFN